MTCCVQGMTATEKDESTIFGWHCFAVGNEMTVVRRQKIIFDAVVN